MGHDEYQKHQFLGFPEKKGGTGRVSEDLGECCKVTSANVFRV